MNPISRITGHVTHVGKRHIVSKNGPMTFTEAIVLVAGRQTVVVSIPDEKMPPTIGEEVDYLVTVSAFRDQPQFRLSDDYPVESYTS